MTKTFPSDFERKLKDGWWQGVFWVAQPTPREISDWGRSCPCHGMLRGSEAIMDHFNMEVEVITKFMEEKFGKVRVLNVGEKFHSQFGMSGSHEMKLFTIRVEDNEGNRLIESMTKEQQELLANEGREINFMTGRIIQAKTEKGREHIKRNIECTGLLPDFTGEQ